MRGLALCPLLLYGCFGSLPAQDAGDYAGKVVSVQNQVEARNGDWTPARTDQELVTGMAVRTMRKSRAVLLLADETQLKLNANSYLELKAVRRSSNLLTRIRRSASSSQESVLNVVRGRAWFRTKRRSSRVKVETPSVTAAIRGTEIDVRVEADGESFVSVLEGGVELSNDQGRLLVNAGEQGKPRPGEAPTKTILVNPRDAVQWTLYYSAAITPRDYPFRFASIDEARKQLTTIKDPLVAAELQHDAGNLPAAMRSLGSIDTPRAAEIRGWIFLVQNRLQDAIRELLRAPIDSARRRLGLSLAHYRLGDWDQAYRLVEDPGDLGSLRLQKAMLDLLVGDVPESRALLESVAPDQPSYALAQALLAEISILQNQKDLALESAQRALRARPESPSAHLSLSRVQQSRFDLDAALRSAQRALELDPEFLQAQVQYAKLLFGQGRNARAERIVREALDGTPESPEMLSLLGYVLLARGKTPDALVHFHRAVEQDPNSSEARMGMGIAHMRQGKKEEAALRILEATTLNPRISLYQSYLGKAFYEQHEFEQAFVALGTAKELDPRDPTPHLYSGIFWNDLNQPGEAIREFRESIRLNNNRAVYRSRFLLDQDRATRNVRLAKAYNRLGLSEWANREAIRSSQSDPSNHSSRLFLADTFVNLKGLTLAAGSELLWARLLLPANANSFNSFNDYTTLFELPRLDGTAEGSYGSFDAARGTLVSSGGASRYAFGSELTYDWTAGFRPVNDFNRGYTGFSLFKYALTSTSDIFFSYSYQQNNRGDPGASPLVSDRTDRNIRVFNRSHLAEVGYHHQLRPGSDVVFLFSGRDIDRLVDDPDFLRRPTGLGSIDVALRRSQRTPNSSLQAVHLLDLEKLRLRYGMDLFEGRSRTRDLLSFEFPSNPPIPVLQEFQLTREEIRYRTGFVQADYDLNPHLILTLGLNYDWANDDNRLDEDQNSASRLNPQGGLLFSPFDQTTFRLVAARVLQTHLQESLAPVHINGFPLDRNESEMTRSNAYHWAWDQILGSKSFLRTAAFYRDNSTPISESSGIPDFSGSTYGGEIVFNRFLGDEWTMVTKYSLEHSEITSSLRRDHEFGLSMFYTHRRGFGFRVREEYFSQDGRFGLISPQVDVWTTDAALSYEFPGKRGLIALEVKNLFDMRYTFLANPLDRDPRQPRRKVNLLLRFSF